MADSEQSILDRICATGFVEDAQGSKLEAFPLGVWPDAGRALYDIVRRPGVEKTVEVGMAYGISTLFIARALRDKGAGHHTAIDPEQHTTWQSIGVLNLKRAALEDLVTIHATSDYVALPRLLEQGELYDFAFIDGMHAFDYVMLAISTSTSCSGRAGTSPSTICGCLPDARPSASPCGTCITTWPRGLLGERMPLRTQLRRLMRDVPPFVRRTVILQNPLNRFYLGFIGRHGCFTYCVLQKRTNDDRARYHYRRF